MKKISNSVKKTGLIVTSIISLSVFASSALASSASSYGVGKPPSGWFVGGGTAMSFSVAQKNTQKMSSAMGVSAPDDTYTTNSKTGFVYNVILNAGYQWSRQALWIPAYSLGLEYGYFSSMGLNGVINRFSMGGRFYDYKYDVSQQLFLLHFKLDLLQWHRLMPFVSASAGLALNKADNFAITGMRGTTSTYNPNFGSATTPQFSYGFGAGIDYWLASNVQMTLVYQYLNAGQVKTGKSSLSSLGSSVLSNKLSSNSVLVKAVYIFN